ncbi:GDSL esterase/lipase At4g10955-like [Silene latifolia]|uniref:GDSL esterase/lipase At4g10955-like n=1 Tax=Silene latifolia TaxID=37657 RepID=UPI003D77221E
MTKAPSERELFDVCGPIHLQNIDWSEPSQKRSITASLVQGVYVSERDRQQKRVDHNALAPIWWKIFDFALIQMLVDNDTESSIFGAIFEYQPSDNPNENDDIPPQSRPPKYVIAFRGCLMKSKTRYQDLHKGARLFLNKLTRDPRYQTSLEYVQDIVAQVGPENVWLTGHSLGAAIALQIGKTMARQGRLVEAYLFNPPYPSAPFDMLTNQKYKTRFRVVSSLATAAVSVVLKGTTENTQQYDPFTILSPWKPYLFVNQYDPFCCGYIGYFEHREYMEKKGFSGIERVAAKDTLVSIVSGACGKDGDAHHLIPTALLVTNSHPTKVEFKIAHGIHQWWAPYLNLQSVTYEFDKIQGR